MTLARRASGNPRRRRARVVAGTAGAVLAASALAVAAAPSHEGRIEAFLPADVQAALRLSGPAPLDRPTLRWLLRAAPDIVGDSLSDPSPELAGVCDASSAVAAVSERGVLVAARLSALDAALARLSIPAADPGDPDGDARLRPHDGWYVLRVRDVVVAATDPSLLRDAVAGGVGRGGGGVRSGEIRSGGGESGIDGDVGEAGVRTGAGGAEPNATAMGGTAATALALRPEVPGRIDVWCAAGVAADWAPVVLDRGPLAGVLDVLPLEEAGALVASVDFGERAVRAEATIEFPSGVPDETAEWVGGDGSVASGDGDRMDPEGTPPRPFAPRRTATATAGAVSPGPTPGCRRVSGGPAEPADPNDPNNPNDPSGPDGRLVLRLAGEAIVARFLPPDEAVPPAPPSGALRRAVRHHLRSQSGSPARHRPEPGHDAEPCDALEALVDAETARLTAQAVVAARRTSAAAREALRAHLAELGSIEARASLGTRAARIVVHARIR